jgi:hypothetical protein
LKRQEIIQFNVFLSTSCSGKLIIHPSQTKIRSEFINCVERIHGNICGLIYPLCGPFRYYMNLIDASTRWSHIFVVNPELGICEINSSNNSNKS